MSAVSNVSPINVGTYLTSAQGSFISSLLGTVYKFGTEWFRLVQAGATDLPINTVVVTGRTAGIPNWVVTAPLLAANPDVAGVVPEEFTAAIPASSYFLLQISGSALVVTSDTTVIHTSGTEFRLVTSSANSGQAKAAATYTTASTTDDAGVFGIATNSAVATATGTTIRCFITGLGY